MAAAARHCPASWADLQPELVGLVLRRLPSLADRVRLAAVCRPWRHSAQLEPVPRAHQFPWLILGDCTFVSIPDGKIYRLPLVPPPSSKCHGSVGNWLFLEQHQYASRGRGSPPLSLMNPFSKDVMQLPDADTIWRHEPVDDHPRRRMLLKLVLLSSSMDLSPDSLLAVLITDCTFESVISICQSSTASAFRVHDHERIRDVAHVDGKLYALSFSSKIFVLEVESSSECKPKIPSMKCIANHVLDNPIGILRETIAGEMYTYWYWDYLVESSDKLLHVRRLIGCSPALLVKDRKELSRTFSFDVFEVDLTTSSSVKWRRLNSLGGQALFLGPYSKALQQASEYGAQAVCIYFIYDYDWRKDCYFTDPLYDSGVFNMRNETITPLLPHTMVMQKPKSHSTRPTWFFPY